VSAETSEKTLAELDAARIVIAILLDLHHGRMPDRLQDAVRAYERAKDEARKV
jgi:hypothetical protein